MSRGALQTMFGVAVGLIARLALPGHHPMGLLATGLLSLVGALGGSLAAESVLPNDTPRLGRLALSAIGALMMLLVYGIAVH